MKIQTANFKAICEICTRESFWNKKTPKNWGLPQQGSQLQKKSCLWSSNFFVCCPFKGCIRPSAVQHGSSNLTSSNRNLFPVGTVFQYSCDPGYLPVGRSILTCTSLGYWSSEPPRCIRSDGKHKPLTWMHAWTQQLNKYSPLFSAPSEATIPKYTDMEKTRGG